eukprot:CAMPEP_0172663592 /NCGR_PEP_ID=MMETSP1074-20121228/6032_1 /TAXON_ID=2916 /ORGANISM="Ceratium fusus, Strain PA161109" /LENGTH=266 /DNA_ID=CAMNT_0013479617 /DNA_START=400 /DNA_END=1200 /DNA_ORIENTATION=-
MTMQVSNAASFVRDARVATVVAEQIAGIAGVPASWTNVSMKLLPRRLLEATERRIQSGAGVQVDYEILVPAAAAFTSAGNVATFSALLAAAQPAAVTALLNAAVIATVGPGAYTVLVTGISKPVTVQFISSEARPSCPPESADNDKSTSPPWVLIGIIATCTLLLCFSTAVFFAVQVRRRESRQVKAASNDNACNEEKQDQTIVDFEETGDTNEHNEKNEDSDGAEWDPQVVNDDVGGNGWKLCCACRQPPPVPQPLPHPPPTDME